MALTDGTLITHLVRTGGGLTEPLRKLSPEGCVCDLGDEARGTTGQPASHSASDP